MRDTVVVEVARPYIGEVAVLDKVGRRGPDAFVLAADDPGVLHGLVADDELVEDCDEGRVEVGLADEGVHETREVDLSRGKGRRLVVVVVLHDAVEQRVVEQEL